MDDEEERHAVANVIDRLANRFPEVPRPRIEMIVESEYEALSGRPVRLYIPVLVERESRGRLHAEASTDSDR